MATGGGTMEQAAAGRGGGWRRATGLVVLAAALLGGGCGEQTAAAPTGGAPGAAGAAGAKGAASPAPPPEVGVALVQQRPVAVTSELPGRTAPFLVAQVRARVDGIVQKRLFKEGADVRAGQLLYQIDPAAYRATLASAQAALMKAQSNAAAAGAQAARYKVLVAENAVSRQEYDNAVAAQGQTEADIAAGRAAVQTATINLGYTQVTAPISGRIGVSQVTEGAYVQGGAATLLATVQQTDPIYVDLNQSSVEGLRLRREVSAGRLQLAGPNQAKVSLVLEDGTRYSRPGRLQFTDITVDQGTGSVTVRAVFPNPDHVLLPGMFVRAVIEQGVEEGALVVPQVGVTRDAKGQATALVVGPDDKVALRQIVAERASGAYWVVRSGLAVGERVVVEGVQKVRPGQQVRAVQAAAPEGRSVSADILTGPARERGGADGPGAFPGGPGSGPASASGSNAGPGPDAGPGPAASPASASAKSP